jgi:hypothetical protein
MPLADRYWRAENMLLERVFMPTANWAPKNIRGLVNELAFIAFCKLRSENFKIDRDVVFSSILDSLPIAVKYINRVSGGYEVELSEVDDRSMREAAHLTLKLLHFFPTERSLTLRPKFSGCGIISECEGDVIAGTCLYEVKAGDRGFRVADIRQLLIYAALAHASNTLNFNRIGLINPRTGMVWVRTLDAVCLSISGLKASDVLSKLIGHLTPAGTSR